MKNRLGQKNELDDVLFNAKIRHRYLEELKEFGVKI